MYIDIPSGSRVIFERDNSLRWSSNREKNSRINQYISSDHNESTIRGELKCGSYITILEDLIGSTRIPEEHNSIHRIYSWTNKWENVIVIRLEIATKYIDVLSDNIGIISSCNRLISIPKAIKHIICITGSQISQDLHSSDKSTSSICSDHTSTKGTGPYRNPADCV